MSNIHNTKSIPSSGRLFWLTSLLYSCGLLYIAYFPARTDTLPLLLGFGFLFGLYLWSYRQAEPGPIFWWIALAIFLRLLLLPAIPILSDDFYRFIWDGRLLAAGENPFARLPGWYMQPEAPPLPGITQELYMQLNSPNYFTIYPPINQGIFALAAYLSPGSIQASVMVMRIFLLLAEGGTLFLLYKLLKAWLKPVQLLLLYALNPLVILEISGNLHFEGLMIFFLLLAIYCYHQYESAGKKYLLSATAASMAAAVASKLLPLMFLPLWIRRLKTKKLFYLYELCALFIILLFFPLISRELAEGISSSIALYYQKFEFNAGLYYLIREAGYQLAGFNIIWQAGPFLALLTLISIVAFSIHKKSSRLPLAQGMFWVYGIFLLFSLTVHPWYITPLLALSVFTPYRFPVLWSGLIFLTYVAYQPGGVAENYLIVALEYGAVLFYMLWEIRQNKKNKQITKTATPHNRFA
jgi:alpha-1,6-mannosyltransferase